MKETKTFASVVGVLIGLLGLLQAGSAMAQPIPRLAAYLQGELERVPQAIDACAMDEGETWEFNTFYLGIAPYVSFGIPGLVDINVTPDIQLTWSRVDEAVR